MEEVEKVIFRSNISKRAQYYSVCFLTQFCLGSGDSKIAMKLISIYLALFKACVRTVRQEYVIKKNFLKFLIDFLFFLNREKLIRD